MEATVIFRKQYKIWHACAEDDSRAVLTGVYLDPAGYLVAADGFILAIVPCRIEGELPKRGVILQAEIVKAAAEAENGRDTGLLQVSEKTAIAHIKGDLRMEGGHITGAYPKWDRLVPKDAETAPLAAWALDGTRLTRLAEALGQTSNKDRAVKITSSGSATRPFLVKGYDDQGKAYGVLMPMYASAHALAAILPGFKALVATKPETPG